MTTDVAELRNLGPKSARLLKEAGISTLEELRELGAIAAYKRLQFQFGKQVSLNFLWAMAAGLENRDWHSAWPTDVRTHVFLLTSNITYLI